MRFLRLLPFFIVLLFNNAANADSNSYHQDARNHFYQNSNVNQLLQIANYPPDPGSSLPRQIFINLALEYNPKIESTIIKQFGNLSPGAQQLFLNAFLADGNSHTNQLATQYNLTPQATLTSKQINNLTINDDPANLDILWNAYFATGNIAYPEKILRFISDNDAYIKKVAFYISMGEANCAKMGLPEDGCAWLPIKKIVHDLESRYPAQANTIVLHTLCISSALSSMNDLRKDDPVLNKRLLIVTEKNPNLNYLVYFFPDAQSQGFWNSP